MSFLDHSTVNALQLCDIAIFGIRHFIPNFFVVLSLLKEAYIYTSNVLLSKHFISSLKIKKKIEMPS